jgi:hypothetical protein
VDGSAAQGLARITKRLNEALRNGDPQAVEACCQEMKHFREAAQAASEAALRIGDVAGRGRSLVAELNEEPAAIEPAAPIDIYWISSATIAQAFAYLTQRLPGAGQEPEWMLAVTGLRWHCLRTLDHLVEVRIASQSGGQAKFDTADFTRVGLMLDDHGQGLHGVLHSHRFKGPPRPSAVDAALQATLDQGYRVIQAVFSEDGYVRFFGGRRRFAVQVYGKGVQADDEDQSLFRIVQFGALPYPGALAAGTR